MTAAIARAVTRAFSSLEPAGCGKCDLFNGRNRHAGGLKWVNAPRA
jgi:hypothetical protein